MDVPKPGESSRLVLPDLDVIPPKHLHASQDLISLLHLDGLYNTYVRPYFDPVPETDDEGAPPKRPRKKQGLSKGYVGLLEDCMDPVPLGNQAEHSLLPLISDYYNPDAHPAQYEAPTLLPTTAFAIARLDAGSKVDGYERGTKLGVKEAHERRMRKKQARLSASVAPDAPELVGTPTPAPRQPPPRPGMVRGRGGGPGGPGRPAWPRASAPPGAAGYRPGTPQRTPGTPIKRPNEGGSVGPNAKRRAMPGSRSASPAGGSGSGGSAPATGPRAVFKRDY